MKQLSIGIVCLLSIVSAAPVQALCFLCGITDALSGDPAPKADKKVYPATMAVKRVGEKPHFTGGMAGNRSQWHIDIDLPVINDHVNNGILRSYVRVIDRHYSEDIRCRIMSAYWSNANDSVYGSWGAYKYSDGSSNNQQVLSTGGVYSSMIRHEFFNCRIPGTYQGNSSYIISYEVHEQRD